MALIDTINHFHARFEFELDNQNEPMQCGFFFMASDTTLPTTYKVNAPLPEKELQTGFWNGVSAAGPWSTSWLANASGTSLSQPHELVGVADIMIQMWSQMKAVSDGNTKLTGITITPYDQSRNAPAGNFHQSITTPIGGTGLGGPHPPFTSLAVGWKSPATGQSQRGRMYLPAIGASMASGQYKVSNTTIQAIIDAVAGGFEDCSTWSVRPVIVHRTSSVVPPGNFYTTYSDIVSVRANDMLDTFKTRGNSITPTYYNVPVVH